MLVPHTKTPSHQLRHLSVPKKNLAIPYSPAPLIALQLGAAVTTVISGSNSTSEMYSLNPPTLSHQSKNDPDPPPNKRKVIFILLKKTQPFAKVFLKKNHLKKHGQMELSPSLTRHQPFFSQPTLLCSQGPLPTPLHPLPCFGFPFLYCRLFRGGVLPPPNQRGSDPPTWRFIAPCPPPMDLSLKKGFHSLDKDAGTSVTATAPSLLLPSLIVVGGPRDLKRWCGDGSNIHLCEVCPTPSEG